MSATLRQRWQARPPRERRAWLALAVFVLLALYAALVAAALREREPLQQRVETLRLQSARMDHQARELQQLRRLPAPADTGETLAARIQAALDAKLPAAKPARLDAADPAHVVVVFEAVAFADWLRWLEDLAARGVRLESCRVEALPAPGQVSATATLARAGPA
ncbi:MAG: type II secretion system protein M [Rhizobium sp.]|nr:type II secretion system protein M [Rhizobium sp.]